jgi:hypothetical protein
MRPLARLLAVLCLVVGATLFLTSTGHGTPLTDAACIDSLNNGCNTGVYLPVGMGPECPAANGTNCVGEPPPCVRCDGQVNAPDDFCAAWAGRQCTRKLDYELSPIPFTCGFAWNRNCHMEDTACLCPGNGGTEQYECVYYECIQTLP